MRIVKAEFVKSSAKFEQVLEVKAAEYAFIGRSNVGKSSLINMLVNYKNLAKTSGRPGKTQLINHFKVNDEWYLVDLPGYGYAKVGKKIRAGFGELIADYIEKREALTNLFVLIDSRLEPQKIDLAFIEYCGEIGVPFCIVFTKIDKLKDNELNINIKNYKKKMLEVWEELPVMFMTSAEKKTGREELIGYIDQINSSLPKQF